MPTDSRGATSQSLAFLDMVSSVFWKKKNENGQEQNKNRKA